MPIVTPKKKSVSPSAKNSNAPKQDIKYKEFALRLEKALARHPDAPVGHGRYKWVKDRLEDLFDVKVSSWGVSKWFLGHTYPRQETMVQLAQVLDVDLSWLALDQKPEFAEKELRKINAVAPGMVNVVAGIFQMAGGQVAISDSADEGVDFTAILNGRQYRVAVALLHERGKTFNFVLPDNTKGLTVVGVVPSKGGVTFDFLYLDHDFVRKHEQRTRGKREITLERNGRAFQSNGETISPVKSLSEIGN